MIHIGLFEGFGGFTVAAQQMGWETLVTCEIADFPNEVLKKLTPLAYHHKDIHTLTYETINAELSKRFGKDWRNEPIILTGGFPCQPYSTAGKRLGKDDDRHLWPQMLRAICEVKPEWVVAENVRGLLSWNGGLVFEEVQADLEAQGYQVQSFILPACGVGAPHRRERIWIVAYRANSRSEGLCGRENETNKHYATPYASSQRRQQVAGSAFSNESPDEGRCPYSNYQPECDEQSRPTTDTSSPRLQERIESRRSKGTAKDGSGLGPRSERLSSNEHVAYSKSIGIQGSGADRLGQPYPRIEQEIFTRDDTGDFWANFPTQPPIRRGNDGFPTESLRERIRKDSMGVISEEEIDKIFRKAYKAWNDEVIKGYGNAVVPPLVYEIYQAIEQYRRLYP